MANVLFVDDLPGIIESYEFDLKKDGHKVIPAYCIEDAKNILKTIHDIDVIVLDMSLPMQREGEDKPEIGLEYLKELCKNDDKPVIMLTGVGGDAFRKKAFEFGAYDYVGKGEDRSTIRARINNAASEGMKSLENHCLKVDMFPGQSEIFQSYLKKLRAIAKWDVNVLIQGESGSGKELAARAIHKLSERSSNRFFSINCIGIASSISESELFGHEPGSFTDAKKRKIGYFESAHKGILFLDEIADLPLEIQGQLLKFLDSGHFMKVGGRSDIYSDVRVVAATNKDLAVLVGDGLFREDLFYRLNTVSVKVPSLRSRPGDILPLTKHLIEKKNWKLTGSQWKRLNEECSEALIKYDWQNNIRELKSFIERIFIHTPGEEITNDQVEIQLRELKNDRLKINSLGRNDQLHFSPYTEDDELKKFSEVVDELLICEKLHQFFNAAYERADRNWAAAAQLIGISDDTLLKYRKKLKENS